MSDPFEGLPRKHFGAILADPPWRFESWGDTSNGHGMASSHYSVLTTAQIAELPVRELAAEDCVLFLWVAWPLLLAALQVCENWGFKYKTCGFSWTKAHAQQLEMFQDDMRVQFGNGYWTRANNEPCLLATCGQPKRLNADVRQAIIAPRREHSRKPDGVHERIERLVAGPYLELFARQQRPNWTTWGNETEKFDPVRDIRESVAVGFEAIRERKANGGPGWEPNE